MSILYARVNIYHKVVAFKYEHVLSLDFLQTKERSMSNELMTQNDFAQQLKEFEQIQDTCKKLLATKHYQALGEAGIHAIMARAKALGIHPFEALNGGFHCINGKVGMSTEMMAALIRRRGHSVTKDPKSTDECVILHGQRADNGDKWTCVFSKADAEAAGLWNSATWKKYPKVMLYNRCMSMLFRQLFPDLSLGAGYVEDELKEITRTGDYEKSIDISAEKVNHREEEQKKIENNSKVESIPCINQAQLDLLNRFINGDQAYLASVMDRLASIKIMSLDQIPITLVDRVLADAKANFDKRQQEKEVVKEEGEQE